MVMFRDSFETRGENKSFEIKWVWVKIRQRNEALDTHIYARAAAAAVGYDSIVVT